MFTYRSFSPSRKLHETGSNAAAKERVSEPNLF